MDRQELEILFTDSEIIVVNKPGNLLAVPGRGPDKQDCVVSRVKSLFPDSIAQPAVHRLDMATSGLMVLARTVQAHRNLSEQFARQQVKKKYIALLDGRVDGKQGKIVLKFRLDPDNRPWQVYDPVHGKTGISRWQCLKISGPEPDDRYVSRIAFRPLTGRTHQLRLHAAHPEGLGCPIIGDSLYGSGQQGDPMFLHAAELSFFHPQSKEWLTFTSTVPF
jgi:tRNA pseudouridine32 synthase/23S rRNA pseudouridine746 synthase